GPRHYRNAGNDARGAAHTEPDDVRQRVNRQCLELDLHSSAFMSRRLYLRLGLPVLGEISTGSSASTVSGSAFAARCRVRYTRVAMFRDTSASPTLSRTSRCIPFALYSIRIRPTPGRRRCAAYGKL